MIKLFVFTVMSLLPYHGSPRPLFIIVVVYLTYVIGSDDNDVTDKQGNVIV